MHDPTTVKEQDMNDKLPWESGQRKWEQKEETTEVSSSGEPQVSDPSDAHKLPQVSEMAEAQQEVAPDASQEPAETQVTTEETRTETQTVEVTPEAPKYHQPEQDGSDSSEGDSSEGSSES